MLFVQYDQG